MIWSLICGVSIIVINLILYFVYEFGNKNTLGKSFKMIYAKRMNVFILVLFIVSQCAIYYFTSARMIYISRYILVTFMYAIALIDIDKHIIPNKILIPMGILGIVNIFINNQNNYKVTLISAVIVAAIFILMSKVTKGQIGMGDAYLFVVLDLWCGIEEMLSIFLFSSFLVAFFGAILMIRSRKNRNKQIPFSPFIMASIILLYVTLGN